MNKTRMKMNIKGWFAGVFNPDNREINQQMAELSKQQREAKEVGDLVTVSQLEQQMQQIEKDNSKEIKFFNSDKCVISRGGRIHEPVVIRPNDANQTKGAQLAANIALIANMTAVLRESQQAQQVANEQTRLDQHIEGHNAQIDKVNAQNTSVNSQIDQMKTATTPDQAWVDAANKQIGQDQALHTGIGHNTEFINDNNGVGFNLNGSDTALHAADQAMKASTDSVRSGLTGNPVQDFGTLLNHHNTITGPAARDMAQAGLETARNWDATTMFHEAGMVDGMSQMLNGNADVLQILQSVANQSSTIGKVISAPGIDGFTISIPSNMAPSLIALMATTATNAKIIQDEAKHKSFNHEMTPTQEETNTKKKDKDKDKDDEIEID